MVIPVGQLIEIDITQQYRCSNLVNSNLKKNNKKNKLRKTPNFKRFETDCFDVGLTSPSMHALTHRHVMMGRSYS